MAHETNSVFTILKKGLITVVFRLSAPAIQILDSLFLSWSNTRNPGALAASSLTSVSRNFLTHTPGSFFNLLSLKFGDAEADPTETANLFFASYIAAAGLSIPPTLFMVFLSNDFFRLLGQEVVLSQYAQDFFRALAIGFCAVQFFSVNRQFYFSSCGDGLPDENKIRPPHPAKYALPVIGFIETGFFAGLGYALIPKMGNGGSGYTAALTAWLGLGLSLAVLLASKELRQFILQKPDPAKIKKHLRQLLGDGAPISLRFVLENLSLVGFSLLAGSISQDSLTALQIAWTLLLPQTSPCFSFTSGTKSMIKKSVPPKKTAMTIMGITTGYAGLCLIPLSAAARPLTKLFLNNHSSESQQAIQDINQIALPLLASAEVVNSIFHVERSVLQIKRGPTIENQGDDNWYTTGSTFLFLCAAFLPTAYAFGKAMNYGVPGMSGVYLVCMIATALALAPRYFHYFKNPQENPADYWASFFRCCKRKSTASPDPLSVNDTTPLLPTPLTN